jgi:hypothetical protein
MMNEGSDHQLRKSPRDARNDPEDNFADILEIDNTQTDGNRRTFGSVSAIAMRETASEKQSGVPTDYKGSFAPR